jgi:single-strand DNA-binding protein
MSFNKVYLLGNVGRDPEVRTSQSGKFATFTLATTDRAYTTSSGVQVPERTEWHNIVVGSNGLAGVVEKYVRKGTKLFVEGKIRTRKYTGRDNAEHYVTEILVDNFELLGGKSEQASAPAAAPNPNPPFYNQQRSQAPGAPSFDGSGIPSPF